jgi:glycosyltransferase involved in cell wall biosynthesis
VQHKTQTHIGLTVITPVLNGARFIAGCIENVISQIRPNVEHLIVDGGSNDGTAEIARDYARKHSHIRLISERDNGQSDAMNRGIALATNPFVGFLNVDDFYADNAITRLFDTLAEEPNIDLLVGNCNIIDISNQVVSVIKPASLRFIDILSNPIANPVPANPSAYFYRRSLHDTIGLYRVDDHFAMDLDFMLRAVQVARIKYLDETLGNYRWIPGTKTFDNSAHLKGIMRDDQYYRQYRRDLPLAQRLHVTMAYESFSREPERHAPGTAKADPKRIANERAEPYE